MTKITMKIFPALFFWLILAFIIFQVPYPQTLTQAKLFQIAAFFPPLILAFVFTANIFFKNLLVSLAISLALVFLLILKALNSLNIASSAFVVISSALLISYFRKMKKRNLTKLPKIPKLTRLRKQ